MSLNPFRCGSRLRPHKIDDDYTPPLPQTPELELLSDDELWGEKRRRTGPMPVGPVIEVYRCRRCGETWRGYHVVRSS